jgi:hypothetical protein
MPGTATTRCRFRAFRVKPSVHVECGKAHVTFNAVAAKRARLGNRHGVPREGPAEIHTR